MQQGRDGPRKDSSPAFRAVVTINDSLVEPNIDGEFSLDVPLDVGPNIIEVVASVASGEQMDLVLVAIYLP